MTIDEEIEKFDTQSALLLRFIDELANVDQASLVQEHFFLAEAITFRLYRIYESLTRASFLNYCVASATITGSPVSAKLKCIDWETAEAILKSGNKFLDWGNVEAVREMANLVFENGFPVVDLVSPVASTLKDLQRFRNFVAHDSSEAAEGFKKSRTQYIRTGDEPPETVGALSLYRRNARSDITIKIIHSRVSGLSTILRAL